MVNSNGHSSSDTPESAGERSREQRARSSAVRARAARRFSRGTFASFASRNYLLLWLGMICLMGGVQMQMIARGYLVYELTERPLLLGIVNGGSAIPILLLSLWGGAIADRVDRKKIIQGGQGINAAIAHRGHGPDRDRPRPLGPPSGRVDAPGGDVVVHDAGTARRSSPRSSARRT